MLYSNKPRQEKGHMQIKHLLVIAAAMISLSGCVSPSANQSASSAPTSIRVWTQSSSARDIYQRTSDFALGDEVVVVISGIALNPNGLGTAGVGPLSQINCMMMNTKGVRCEIQEASGKQADPNGPLRFWSNSARKEVGNEATTGFGYKWPAGEFKVILRDRTDCEIASSSFKVKSQ